MVIAILATGIVNATELTDKLASLTEVNKVKELKSTDGLEKLVCFVNQQLDWDDATEGPFGQRVII